MRSFHATRQVQCNADRKIGRASGRYSFHSPLAPTEIWRTREEPEREDRAMQQTLVAHSSLKAFRNVPARSETELRRPQRNDNSPGLSLRRFDNAWILNSLEFLLTDIGNLQSTSS